MTRTFLLSAAAALALAACSGGDPVDDSAPVRTYPDEDGDGAADAAAPASPENAANPDAPQRPATPGEASSPVPPLTASGFGPHQVGQPIVTGGPAPPREVDRISETCHMYKDPNLPGVWIMTDGDEIVRRVTVLSPSTLTTAKGIGVGASEAEVRAAYPGTRKEPSEYTMAPGGNLYAQPDGQPGLRFDVDEQRKVVEISAGQPPFLGYSEGCA